MPANPGLKLKLRLPDEILRIKSGSLGPLGPMRLFIRPLTVFIGRQGTGKSLLAQMLYFFRGLPNLVRFDLASRRLEDGDQTPAKIVRRIVDGMRSSHRSFARLTAPGAALEWSSRSADHALLMNIQSATSQVNPSKALRDRVAEVIASRAEPPLSAVFVPTERLLYAMQLGPNSLRVMNAPLLLETFAQMMDTAAKIQSDWVGGEPDTAQGVWIREHLRGALAGEARLRGSSWRWMFKPPTGRAREIDLDMASSGQRANWPLSIIPQVLFSLRSRGKLAKDFTLYVEEPEIHLHPSAQQAVVEVLAFLVRQGFRVVLTTHSLTVLYTLNNLLLAGKLGPKELVDEVPLNVRLKATDVAAYHVTEGGTVESLLGAEGVIDESALGAVADDLSMQMNRILLRLGPDRR